MRLFHTLAMVVIAGPLLTAPPAAAQPPPLAFVQPLGPAAVDFLLDVRLGKIEVRRAAVDDGPEGLSMRFPEGGDPEEHTDAVT